MHSAWAHQFRAVALLLLVGLSREASAAPTTLSTLAPAAADRTALLPKRLKNVGVTEHLDQKLPLHLDFHDEAGRAVKLQDYFRGDVPVVVTLNYSNCPMLCSLVLTGFVDGLKQVPWELGKDYRVITVSLDPTETQERAHRSQQRYLKQYGRGGETAKGGWHFLTGKEENIQALARAIGFSYNYNEKRQEYVHPASVALMTPAGQIARYLYGIEYNPKTLSLALVEASQGKIGTTVDQLMLFCFHYDASEGRYAPVARNIMKLGGAGTVFGLGAFLAFMWRSERKRKPRAA
ncbi:MAG: SCO family protein [Polyangiaceae bacterium]|nr:SCO family protein [Polyangiaceae bacterium]